MCIDAVVPAMTFTCPSYSHNAPVDICIPIHIFIAAIHKHDSMCVSCSQSCCTFSTCAAPEATFSCGWRFPWGSASTWPFTQPSGTPGKTVPPSTWVLLGRGWSLKAEGQRRREDSIVKATRNCWYCTCEMVWLSPCIFSVYMNPTPLPAMEWLYLRHAGFSTHLLEHKIRISL